MPTPIGISLSREVVGAVAASNVRVILQRDSLMTTGYRIVTGYPTP